MIVRPDAAAVAANRFGLGARPGELAAASADPRGWLLSQVREPLLLKQAGLLPSAEILARAASLRQQRRERKNSDASASAEVAFNLGRHYRPIYLSEAAARTRLAVATDRSFAERLVQFWANHFAVSVDKPAALGLAGAFEREAVRPNLCGRFADMLLAVERHPAMLTYLDNHLSIGPDSTLARRAARRRKRELGLNENLAREILELHTLGADGGYSQADVTSFAKVITGWSIGGSYGPLSGGEPGQFHFREALHEPGAQVVLGRRYGQDGIRQGEAVLADLARHPATAMHVSLKLARHFVADDPPAAVLERLLRAWKETDGSLPALHAALVDSPEAWATPVAKYKTPSDYLLSAWRALDAPLPDDKLITAGFQRLGQPVWMPGSPAGWADRATDWDGSAALKQRIEFASLLGARMGDRVDALQLAESALGPHLSVATRQALQRAASRSQALTLALAAPEFQRR